MTELEREAVVSPSLARQTYIVHAERGGGGKYVWCIWTGFCALQECNLTRDLAVFTRLSYDRHDIVSRIK